MRTKHERIPIHKTHHQPLDPYKAEAEGQEQATQAAPDACVVMAAKAKRKRRKAEAVARHGSFPDPGLAGVANGPMRFHETT